MKQRITRLIFSLLFVAVCAVYFKPVVVQAAVKKDDTGNWTCTSVDSDDKTANVKPAKTGVAGVSKGAVTIPKTVKISGVTYKVVGVTQSGYAGNTAVTSVKFASGSYVVSINDHAFNKCTALTEVSFANATKLATICSSAFEGCTKLDKLTSFNSTVITKINASAFSGCTALGKTSGITFPAKTITIGKSAFYNCSAISKINASTAVFSSVGTNAFYNAAKSKTFYVKNATVYNLVTKSGTIAADLISYNYTITYSGNGNTGGSTPGNKTVVYTDTVTIPANSYTKTGYTFSSWNTAANGTGTACAVSSSKSKLTKTGAITLYARWTANKYYIKFNANGGSGTVNTVTATYDVNATLTKNSFTRTGYLFKCWNTKADGTGTSYTNSQVVKNLSSTNGATVNLYAIWTPRTYTVVYKNATADRDLVEGTSGTMSNDTFTYDVTYKLKTCLYNADGYKFAGWVDGNGKKYTDSQSVRNLVSTGSDATSVNMGTYTLYATWTPYTYSVEFYTDNKYTVKAAETINTDVDKGFILPECTATKTGYHFVGWYNKDCRPGDDISVLYIPVADDTVYRIYAAWEKNSYKIHFLPYEGYKSGDTLATGYAGSQADQTFEFDVSQKLKLCNYTRTGYTFAGWKDEDGRIFADGEELLNYKDEICECTFTAQWTPVTYKLSFNIDNANGNIEGSAPETITCEYDGSFTIPAYSEKLFKREFYIFTGWTLDPDGVADNGNSSDLKNILFQSGQTYKYNLSSKANAKITLYAQWASQEYKITYKNVSGLADQSFSYGESVRIRDVNTDKTGYTFDGWNTRADGKGQSFDAGSQVTSSVVQKISKLCTNDNGVLTLTLYPVWTANKHTVYCYRNDGSDASATEITVAYGQTYSKLSDVTKNTKRVGYTFKGWSTSEKKFNQVKPTDKLTKDDDVVLYAHWTPITYKVTFNCNGGKYGKSSSFTKTYKYEAVASSVFKSGALPKPKKKGYIFKKWVIKGSNKTLSDGSEIKSDMTVKASWTKVKANKVVAKKSIISKITSGNKKGKYSLTLLWNCRQADGYEVRYATKKKALKSAKISVTTQKTIKLNGLAQSTYLYVQVRSYKKDSMGNKIYSSWTTFYDTSPNKVTITFNANSGKIGKKTKVNVKAVKGKALRTAFLKNSITVKNPKKKGYTFEGWYYKNNKGKWKKVTTKTVFKKNTTVYAKWKKK